MPHVLLEGTKAAHLAAKDEAAVGPNKVEPIGKSPTTGEVVDIIADTVHEIENLKKADARALIDRLNDEAAFSQFKLGGVLKLIRSNGWYDPHETFEEFCKEEHGILLRKAQRLMQIYEGIVEAKVPWAKVKHVEWTKLLVISPMLIPDNAEHWIKIAEEHKTLQLVEFVRNAKKGAVEGHKQLDDQTVKTVTTMTFKLHEDQRATIEAAIEKAKQDANTQYDTAALEYICLDFMGSKPAPQLSVVDWMKHVGIDAAVKAFKAAFPDVEIAIQMPAA
jgi:hypothetical protein